MSTHYVCPWCGESEEGHTDEWLLEVCYPKIIEIYKMALNDACYVVASNVYASSPNKTTKQPEIHDGLTPEERWSQIFIEQAKKELGE